ncbi:DUF6924 domain-containing protein [Actinomadura sp. 6N118]|uniref:DUF6924 domain-containing protein n=1 Tax=Actinomadura sp. 6N118 TaxID=3375151 RepID=UPI00378D2A43
MTLPQPNDLTSLVLRTDFGDDSEWQALQAVIDSYGHGDATYVGDLAYAGATVQALVEANAAAQEDEKLAFLFLADSVTMTDPETPLLAVDLFDEPGRTFRVPPRWYAEISANLCIANMDFADYADASGTFSGFNDM